MVLAGQLEVDFRFSFLFTDFCIYIDGHPQAMVVLFSCSLVMQGFKEATMGITVCLLLGLFVCVLAPRNEARGGRVAYTVYLPDVWLQLG